MSEQLPRKPRTLEELSVGTLDAAETVFLSDGLSQIHATKFQKVQTPCVAIFQHTFVKDASKTKVM